MCGFVGFWADGRVENGSVDLRKMLACLVHRGPDADGFFEDRSAGFFLGHRRLSIIDLSAAGAQPMVSTSGRFVLALNGEIYNFRVIRAELESKGIVFRGNSDTEVLLQAVEEWGLQKALEKSTGMFAIALWDREKKELSLARDRAGEKPLYYGWLRSGVLAFGSELKALRAHSDFRSEIDRIAVSQYLQFSYIPEPRSIYKGIHKLAPGASVTFQVPSEKKGLGLSMYWNYADVVGRAKRNPFTGDLEAAVTELDSRLQKIVKDQMISDVPLGAFLSGGIDSSLIVATMQTLSSRPVKTFTIGFEDQAFDESKSAQKVATALGTDHSTLYVSHQDALDVIPSLSRIYDEPFADSSQIPTYLVAKLARQFVTVALSGDGGDEVFGGYTRYFIGAKLSDRLNKIPSPVRRVMAGGLDLLSPHHWDAVFKVAGKVLNKNMIVRQPGLKMQKLANAFRTSTPFELYEILTSIWPKASQAMTAREYESRDAYVRKRFFPETAFAEFMMQYDFLTYLTDDILVKVDRAGMAVSLESRIPFLDHTLIEWAWSLPLSMKVQNGSGKVILKKLLARHLKPELFERPKMGFGIPLNAWLRGPLRAWAEALIAEKRIRSEGYFDYFEIDQKWREHLSGKRDWSHALWNVFMFQAWMDEQKASNQTVYNDLAGLPATVSPSLTSLTTQEPAPTIASLPI